MSRARVLADYVAGGTTAAEFDHMDGVTSNVQTQLDAKAPLASPAFTGTPTGITAAHLEAGVLPSDVTGGSGLTHLASNPTVTLGSNATFPAGHIIQTIYNEYGGGDSDSGTSGTDAKVEASGSYHWTGQITNVGASNHVLVTMAFNAQVSGSTSYLGAGFGIWRGTSTEVLQHRHHSWYIEVATVNATNRYNQYVLTCVDTTPDTGTNDYFLSYTSQVGQPVTVHSNTDSSSGSPSYEPFRCILQEIQR